MEYTIKKGDSLWSISKKTLGKGTRWTEIAQANGLKQNSLLLPGKKIIIPDDNAKPVEDPKKQKYKDAMKLVQEYEQWPDEAKQDFANAAANGDVGEFYQPYLDAIQYVESVNEKPSYNENAVSNRTEAMRGDYDIQLSDISPDQLQPSGAFLVDNSGNQYVNRNGKIYQALYRGKNKGGDIIGKEVEPNAENIGYKGTEYKDVPTLYMYHPELQGKPLYYLEGSMDEIGMPMAVTINRVGTVDKIKNQLEQLRAAGATDDDPEVQRLNNELEKYNEIHRQRVYDEILGKNNPITGQIRIDLSKYFKQDNPFKWGSDMAGNIAANLFLGYAGGLGLSGLFNKGLARGATRLGLGLVGGHVGGNAFNNYVMEPLTGKTWEEMMYESGARGLPVWVSNPGGWVTAYGLSRAGDWGMERIPAGYNNAKIYGLTYEGQPVETVKLIQPIETKLPGGQYVGARYVEHTSSPKAGRNTSGQKSWTTGKPNRAGQGVTSRASGNNTYSVRAETTSLGRNPTSKLQSRNYTFDRSHGNGFPLFFNQYNAPLITPPPIMPFEVHYDQTKPYYDPWETWYSQQPEGTIQYWKGDPNSQFQVGPYEIKRVYNFGATQNKQYDDEGWNVPGRTWTSGYQRVDGPMYVDQTLYENEGGIPKNEKRDYTQRVDTSKSKKRKK